MTFQKTSDTQLAINVKGSDGVVRTAILTLSSITIMPDFTVTLIASDSVSIDQKNAGIAAALAAYNIANPDAPIADAQSYVDFVMNMATESYARQYAISS